MPENAQPFNTVHTGNVGELESCNKSVCSPCLLSECYCKLVSSASGKLRKAVQGTSSESSNSLCGCRFDTILFNLTETLGNTIGKLDWQTSREEVSFIKPTKLRLLTEIRHKVQIA